MNKYDWKNAFPKPSENFHNKLCMTLDSFEKENVKMKKVSHTDLSCDFVQNTGLSASRSQN